MNDPNPSEREACFEYIAKYLEGLGDRVKMWADGEHMTIDGDPVRSWGGPTERIYRWRKIDTTDLFAFVMLVIAHDPP